MLSLSVEDSRTASFVVTLSGFALSLIARGRGAFIGAIDLSTITVSADECLQTATGTQIESSTGKHWQFLPMSSDSYPLFGERLLGLCEGTVVSVRRQI